MCTLSWWQQQDSCGVFFNRDESVKRSPADPPALFQRPGCRYLSPLDPDGGGTWIWVNGFGIIGCILNNYAASSRAARNPVSRGVLLKSLACHGSVSAAAGAVEDADHRRFRGFYLFLYDGCSAVLCSWDGERFSTRRGKQITSPLTTSGYLPEEVSGYRKQLYRKQVTGATGDQVDRLERFHSSHNPERPAHSVLMARAEARTVSCSRISVGRELISFAYAEVSARQELGPSILTTMDREA